MAGNTAQVIPESTGAPALRPPPGQLSPPPEAVQAQLERLLSSKTFSRSKDLCRFLRFVVDQTLRNRGVRLKEYLIGVAVFDRGESYNPSTDPIVRVQARRLRAKLNQHYDTEGRDDAIQIYIPSGGYVPGFRYQQPSVPAAVPSALVSPSREALVEGLPGVPEQVSQAARAQYGSYRPSPGRDNGSNFTASTPAGVLHLCRRGLFCLNQSTPDTISVATDCFERAIEANPTYAPAYAGLAGTYAVAGLLGTYPSNAALTRAKALAAKSISLDESLAEAWAARALAAATCEWDFQRAEREFFEALVRGPGLASVHHWYAIGSLLPLGRIDQAIVELRVALEFARTSPNIHTDLAWVLSLRSRQEEALEHCWYALDAAPGFFRAHQVLGSIYESQAKLDKAVAAYDRAAQVCGAQPLASVIAAQGHACALAGRTEEAGGHLATLLERAGRGGIALAVATVHLGLDELDRTFEWLERAVDERDCGLIWLNLDSRFSHLLEDARFQELLSRLHLTR